MITLAARAKINLTLDILGKRSDGYHEVEMVMQSIDLADQVEIEEADEISVATDLEELADDQTNLAYRAAALLQTTYQVSCGAAIRIAKRIPMAAGLAGGSSDAAAVLQGLNHLWKLNISGKELAKLGAQLGSDVPFCMAGGTLLATGRGEYLMGVPPLPQTPVILVKPPIGVSTAWVYQQYRAENVARHPDAAVMIAALARENHGSIRRAMGNVLESVTIPAYPEIARIKEALLTAGAQTALMSGSGPTVFAFAKTNQQAECIAAKMKQQFNDYTICHTVTSQGRK